MFAKKKQKVQPVIERRKMARYLLPIDVWAIAFGCAVGWGAFVMPGTTFLPIAGPAGTLEAMLLGTALMLVIGYNYAWLMKNRPRKGGVYAYTKEAFGRDHAFLCSWFLSLSYLTIVFLNATALFIISRVVLSNLPLIGTRYEIGGLTVFPGEIALSVAVLVVVGILLIRKKPLMQSVQTTLAIILFAGAVVLTLVSMPHFHWRELLTTFGTGGFGAAGAADAGESAALAGQAAGGSLPAFGAVLTLLLLMPWAFVGFEIASLETPHFDFPIRHSWSVMAVSIVSAGFVYTAMTFVAASLRPERYDSWQAYMADLDNLSGVDGVPTFFAAQSLMGRAGLVLITVTALAAILTGVIGAYRATVRMLSTMAEDKILSGEFRGTTFYIVFIMGVSSIFTFLGRSTLDWFVELTSFGATVGFAYTSAAAAKIARQEGEQSVCVTGIIGAAVSGIFALVHLASRVFTVETMCGPSFLMLAVWCLLGFLFYWRTMRQSDLSDFGGVTTSSSVLFCLLFYSVLMWFVKRVMSMPQVEEDRQLYNAFRSSGIVMLLFVIVGLVVMQYTQRWLRYRHARLEREKMHAEESSKAKSQFLFNMSHDIRTPMNAIIGYTHLASLEEGVPPKVQEYIEKIDISGKHLLTLINDVLEMSRIESGKMELIEEQGDICEALQTAYEMFKEQMEEKKIAYTLDIHDVADKWVEFDRNRFLRVVLNLVSNACKFTPEGGRVSVSMTQTGSARKPDRGVYEVRVKDTGIGMTKEFAEEVFEAFARERTSTVSKIQGTGLGMAITKSIVDAMQGSIDVETSPNQGTEFIVRIAYRLSENPHEEAFHTAAQEEISDGSSGTAPRQSENRKKRLLVAEDMEVNRQILEMLLQNFGYEVDAVENGQMAVDAVAASVPGWYDAVLMDIQMPVLDGYGATEKIRELENTALADIPIIAVTANAFGEDVRKAHSVGMDAHISKPIDPAQLEKTLQEVFA